jgi:hypothetical protein
MAATDRIRHVQAATERLDRVVCAQQATDEDRATRTAMHVEHYLAKRRVLEEALKDIAVLKHTLRELAAEIEPRLQGIEGRLVVLARTVGNLLAELDRGHTTTITRIRNIASPTVDPRAPTPRPGPPQQ